MAARHADTRIDALFAAADANKDGKLTKEEFANFVWTRFAKPDAQSVTKEEVKSFVKQKIAALRAERPAGRKHKRQTGAGAPKKEEPKSGAAQPKPAAAPGSSGPPPKAEPKAEAKPIAGPTTAATAPQGLPSSRTTETTPPVPSKSAAAKEAVNNPTGVPKAEAAKPAEARNARTKIGTSTTSRDVKAALFAARR
jgi:hypothetical protein